MKWRAYGCRTRAGVSRIFAGGADGVQGGGGVGQSLAAGGNGLLQLLKLGGDLLGQAVDAAVSLVHLYGSVSQDTVDLVVDQLGPLPGHPLGALGPAVGFQLPVGAGRGGGDGSGFRQAGLEGNDLGFQSLIFRQGGSQLFAVVIHGGGSGTVAQQIQLCLKLIDLGGMAGVEIFDKVDNVLPVETVECGTEIR